ncbi:MAG: ribonuclease E activity regulator RraA [Desulfatitalea sp.]|nr:ribonuclease E activity regulator RraA [Desulfatitalea sp.]
MKVSTPDLCDAHPELVRVVAPLFKNYGGRAAFGGLLATIKCFEDNSRVKECLGRPGDGRVLVVDGGGSRRCALLGDLLAAQAMENGWAGVIVHGCIRDVDAIAGMQRGVQALAATPLKSVRKGQGEMNGTVVFGGVTFHPGEFVYADNNGIIVSAQRLV